MKIVVSACLLGEKCRYDGEDSINEKVLRLSEKNELVPVCPEKLAGLATPRIPCEICCGRILDREGTDLTEAFAAGARKALKIALESGAEMAVLKEKSPSCGVNRIYDGTFTGKLTEGIGIFTRMLIESGLDVVSDESL